MACCLMMSPKTRTWASAGSVCVPCFGCEATSTTNSPSPTSQRLCWYVVLACGAHSIALLTAFAVWQMIFLHVVNLAVLFSDPGQSSFFFLFIFSCLHVIDIGLRIVAEGWSDFWCAACAASHDTWSHAFFTHVPPALIQAFHTSPKAPRTGHQAVRRRRPSLRCHGHCGIGGLDPAGWRVPI